GDTGVEVLVGDETGGSEEEPRSDAVDGNARSLAPEADWWPQHIGLDAVDVANELPHGETRHQMAIGAENGLPVPTQDGASEGGDRSLAGDAAPGDVMERRMQPAGQSVEVHDLGPRCLDALGPATRVADHDIGVDPLAREEERER